jgi:hypothetical protein
MRFKRPWVLHAAALFCAIWISTSCSTSRGIIKEIVEVPGNGRVTLTASRFKFEPSVIEAKRGSELILEIVNVAESDHNLTIKLIFL